MKMFRPDFYATSIFDIDVSFFIDNGIKCVLSDLDNTLDAHDELTPSTRVVEFKEKLNQNGIELCIVSNNKAKRKDRSRVIIYFLIFRIVYIVVLNKIFNNTYKFFFFQAVQILIYRELPAKRQIQQSAKAYSSPP